MSTGTWEPNNNVTKSPSIDFLKKMLSIPDAQYSNLVDQFTQSELAENQYLMALTASDWEGTLSKFEEQELHRLMKLLTIAEEQFPNWQAGDKSPVIWIFKALKKQGKPAPKELVKWVKSNTTNRFLPYGAAL